ncbi:MATE family efflux transporter [Intestinibacter sp.]
MAQKSVQAKQTIQKENKMGTMPVNKLLLSMALPMIISMLVQALYNIVDSIFVAQLSENALTAVSMAFPVQNLMIGTATGIGVGMNAFVSKNLGQHNQEGVNKSALHGIFLETINYLIFLCIGLFAVDKFMQTQTNITEIVEYGTTYLRIVCICSFGIFAQVSFERLLQSTGKTVLSMTTQLTGAVINIILDPILIFGLFGMPKLGIAGAAIATVIGQVIAGTFAVILNLKKNKEIHLHLDGFKLEKKYIGRILYVGIPSVLMVAIGSVMSYGMNLILMTFSSTAVAVFGAYFKLQSFVFMPVFGLNNGMVPIVSFNLGARNKERLVKTVKLGACYAVGIMLVGLIVIQIMPATLLGMFNASEQMLEIGVPALRIISVSFVFAGFCVIASSTFQALGSGLLSMSVSFVRQLVFLLPAAFILSKFGNVNLVWLAFPIAEIAAVLLSAIFLRYLYNKVVKDL